jgi:proton-translocating NADH-quinone oxidoreductase chain L
MYISIVLLPLIGAIVSGFFGFFIGRRGSSIISTLTTFSSFLLSCRAFYEVGLLGEVQKITLFPWMKSGSLIVDWTFLFDSVTVVMLVVVTSVSTLVHAYSTSYMSSDPHLSRFMSYLSFFTFFMLILVTGDNLMQLFTGWEGVGVSSYLLINFWYSRIQATKSALKAMVVNRVGDLGLSFAIAASAYFFGSISYSTIFASPELLIQESYVFYFLGLEFTRLDIIGFCLFIGAMGKSAQITLHTWLPDAMEGPTPVSALIHAATMVTAGVFLLVRCSPILTHMSQWVLTVITIVGALTAFFAATTGLNQYDMKRVIAYSTCSQLGYMIFTCGISHFSLAMFHLTNHAFFKALLFLGAGAVIHSIVGEQDLRKMGGFSRSTPFVYTCMLIASLALMGIPYLAGFYSKDVILETSYAFIYIDSSLAYVMGGLSALCTAYYSFRLIYYAFLGKPLGFKHYYSEFHGTSILMIGVLFILSLGSIFSGYLFKDLFIGPGTNYWGAAVDFISSDRAITVSSEYIPLSVKFIPLFCGVFGASLSIVVLHLSSWLYTKGHSQFLVNLGLNPDVFRSVFNFLGEKWYFDKWNKERSSSDLLHFGYHVSLNTFDRGLVEIIGPLGISMYIPQYTTFVARLNTGHLNNYINSILFGLMLGCLFILLFTTMLSYYSLDFIVFIVFLAIVVNTWGSFDNRK